MPIQPHEHEALVRSIHASGISRLRIHIGEDDILPDPTESLPRGILFQASGGDPMSFYGIIGALIVRTYGWEVGTLRVVPADNLTLVMYVPSELDRQGMFANMRTDLLITCLGDGATAAGIEWSHERTREEVAQGWRHLLAFYALQIEVLQTHGATYDEAQAILDNISATMEPNEAKLFITIFLNEPDFVADALAHLRGPAGNLSDMLSAC